MTLNDGNNDGRRTIENKDYFLESMRKQYGTKQTDAKALETSGINMQGLEYTDMPQKISRIGEPGAKSARPSKVNENPLMGEPKNMANQL